MYRSTIYHSNLSDQSALEIRVRIRVRLKSCTIIAFFTENKENEHLFFRDVTDGNFLLKERTHRIKITYCRNSYALIRQLTNAKAHCQGAECSTTGDIGDTVESINQSINQLVIFIVAVIASL